MAALKAILFPAPRKESHVSDIDRLLTSYLSGHVSRRTFVTRLLALGVSMDFVETLLGPGAGHVLASSVPARPPTRSPHAVLVVMDAFRGDYVDRAPMPNLEWLASRGVTYSSAWVGQLESNTVPSHATISTGATPAHQGVIGFSWRDPVTKKEVYTGWYDAVLAGRLERQLDQHHVNSLSKAIKGADPTARIVSVSSEKAYAADAMGGHAADYILYGHEVGKLVKTLGIPHHAPPATFLNRRSLTREAPLGHTELDEFSMTMALESLSAFDPRVLMINLPACDYYGHRVGPSDQTLMPVLVQNCDQQLGRLIKALRDRGVLDETVFIVTGDHGMITNTHRIDSAQIKQVIGESGGDYLFDITGSAGYIWLRNPPAARAVAQALADRIPHVSFSHYQTIESGVYTYHTLAPAGRTVDPAVDAALRYLLGTFAGSIAPDVVLTFEENTIVTSVTYPHGEHSGPTWGSQHVPLVIAGPGIRVGERSTYPARLMDIAPTILTILGIPPTGMDGVVLADALRAPTRAQIAAQDAVAPALSAHRRALATQSAMDLLAQMRGGVPKGRPLAPTRTRDD
jgi:predicted AlkP superfamily pyrophosphatase or phosphodiesterase